MNKLFEENQLAGIPLRNRFVRSATWEGVAEESGLVSARLIEMMRELAVGEVGLIISSHAYVSPEGRAGNYQLAIDRDECLPGLTELVSAVHSAGGRIAVQLAHAGCSSREIEEADQYAPDAADKAWIKQVAKSFAAAALRGKQAGFDAVQIHAAHGYMLSSFLSPAYNHRTDEYGGSVENRARLLLEVYENIRSVVGDDYPVFMKINSDDFIDGGMTVPDMLRTAAMLSCKGMNAIEMSGGVLSGKPELSPVRRVNPSGPEEEGYYLESARLYKQALKIPLILVGGFRSLGVCRKIVEAGDADYISISRPLIREPDLIGRWHRGETDKSGCISCNACFRPGFAGRGIYCVPARKGRD